MQQPRLVLHLRYLTVGIRLALGLNPATGCGCTAYGAEYPR